MKKLYRKPIVTSTSAYESNPLVPEALVAGAALAGGYVVGRVAKAVEARPDFTKINSLERVLCE